MKNKYRIRRMDELNTIDNYESFDAVGRDRKECEMPDWIARDRQNFVRDTQDGHRVNVYWSCGGYWMIQAGVSDWEFFVGRGGVRTITHAKSFWKRLASARSNANRFAFKHGGWK